MNRIGQLDVGKLATLSAYESFTVSTKSRELPGQRRDLKICLQKVKATN